VNTPASIILDNVTVTFGPTVALNGLSYEVEPGQVTGLVGANGAGKTTSLRLMAGLARARSGLVQVAGLDPARQPVAVRKRIGLLPDRPVLPPHLTVREVIRLRAALYEVPRQQAERNTERLTEPLGLSGLFDRWCRTLSHGQAQRAALATVLVPAPPVILVDEPMTALDLSSQLKVRRLLRELADEGTTVLLTTHTVAHLAQLADRVLHLSEGRLRGDRPGTRDVDELEAWLLAP